jgi:hypothetical protein
VIAQLHSAYLGWLALVWDSLDALEQQGLESEGASQHQDFVFEMLRLRQECRALGISLRRRFASGLFPRADHDRMQRLLRDLLWLLDVPPAAPPALAKQCVRMAQDRIVDEVQQVSTDAPARIVRYENGRVATV